MSSKKMFSWSKRQSTTDQYYRTGGLLSIEASPEVGNEAKATPKSGRRRPSDLKIVTTDNKQFYLSPRSASYNVALTSAASNLQAVFNDLLRSPAPCVVGRPASVSIHNKPLPGRPRSVSLPSTPDLPAELPGSLLQENQGFPPCAATEEPVTVRPASHYIRRSTQLPDINLEDGEEFTQLLNLFPEPLGHSKSVPDFKEQHGEMRSVRSGNALNSGATPKPSPLKVQHKKSLSDTGTRRRSKPNLTTSPSSADNKLTTTSTATPTSTRSKQIEEHKATIATQDQTISTLQTQFSSLRASHDSHVLSLTESHSAEVASLKNYARVLEEQLAHRPSLHHASSNNLLFVLDTTEPQTPTREGTQQPADTGSAASIKSFQTAFEKQQRSPQRTRNSPEMENLKRRLSSTRRPETASRNLLPELNQYKQNNVALQKQIESLMAKLNDSKKSERALKASLDETTQKFEDWRVKAEEADKAAKGAQALQNTIDHLENRLEIANVEKLDAQEELFNVQSRKSPFDISVPKLRLSTNAHLSMSTVFSSGSPTSPENESQELSTLAAFIAHIERLQDQVRQKDAQISELEDVKEQLQHKHNQLEQDHNALNLQMDIQHDLLRKTRRTDKHIEQLRTAVMDRETIISEKERSIRAVERQLEHHKLLLQSEIRRHTTLTLHAAVENDPLPELDTLTARKDIDRWIENLHQRLKRERTANHGNEPVDIDPNEAQLIDLRQEIDFYVREIIYYKLDIRGYKSDIKKLKKITAQLSSYGSRTSDLESETSSLRPPVTPSRVRFPSATPELGVSDVPSPVLTAPTSKTIERPMTPPPSGPTFTPSRMLPAEETASNSKQAPLPLDFQLRDTPQTPTRRTDVNMTIEGDLLDPGVSPRSVVRLSPERRKLTPPSPDRTWTGGLLTNFPLSTAEAPRRRERSMSESTVPLYKTISSPECSPRFGGDSGAAGQATNILAEATRHYSNQRSHPQSPRRSRNNSNASSVLNAPPHMAKDMQTSIASSPSPIPPSTFRSRAGSTGSTTANTLVCSSPPERKLSAASSSNIPFVIAMGSPHNPALISPAASMAPTSCSITRYAPLKINSNVSRTGVGGTMSSSTPVTSPISPTDIPWLDPPARPMTTKPTSVASAAPARKLSLSKKQEDQVPGPPRTPSHSRNVSGGSIRTAIRMPKAREKEKEAHKTRKDSISMPRPLGSPFDIDRAMSVSTGGRRDENVHGIGEAI
ncbi:hypothetical protein CC86DRAFT_348672 [Ophiobolus disseminans]|uniref:Uncharacterized protein n=1 Tax=Ophiobolus disseminans TaxID=1469910 RepID=A0A6A7A3I6_9PLEO|nr:hypothetical protein CC86DRAFT_348672 [Ophiobolus disseminans]